MSLPLHIGRPMTFLRTLSIAAPRYPRRLFSSRPPLPPFTRETAVQKVRLAEDAWNTRDPPRVALACERRALRSAANQVYAYRTRSPLADTVDTKWRNRDEFINGREEVEAFLTRKWSIETDYRLIKELFAFMDNRIAVRYCYEFVSAHPEDEGSIFRAYGLEHWLFDENGLMERRWASINNIKITESERKFKWGPLGRRPDDHPGLSALGL